MKKEDEKLPWWRLHHICGGENTTLIPRNVVTNNIQVFAFRIDMEMDEQSSSQRISRSQKNAAQRRSSPAHAAILANDLDKVKRILNQQPDLINSHDEEGRTPLSCAAHFGYVDIVEYLLQEFPDSKNQRNDDKESSYAVHKACLRGNINVLKTFHSISPESLLVTNRYGQTVLHLAKNQGNRLKKVVSYLKGLPGIGAELLRIKDENDCLPCPS